MVDLRSSLVLLQNAKFKDLTPIGALGTNHRRLDIGSQAMLELVQPMKNGLHFHETEW